MLLGHDRKITALAWSADGLHLASAGENGILKVWNAATGSLLQTHDVGLSVRQLVWSPGGQRVAAVANGANGGWQVANLQTQKVQGRSGDFIGVAWAPDSQSLHALNGSGALVTWELETLGQESQRQLEEVPGGLQTASWSADGKWLAASSGDGGTRADVWDAATGKRVQSWPRTYPIARQLAWAPLECGDSSPLSPTHRATIDVGVGAKSSGGTGTKESGDKSPHSKARLAAVGERVYFFDIDRPQPIATSLLTPGNATITWSPDGQYAATVSVGRLQILDPDTGEVLQTSADRGRVEGINDYCLDMSRNGEIVDFCWSCKVWRWKAATGELDSVNDRTAAYNILESPTGKMLALFGYNSEVQLVESTTGHPLQVLKVEGPQGWFGGSWSPDGKKFAIDASDGRIHVFNAYDGKAVQTLSGHKGKVVALASSKSDGKSIASAGDDNTLRLWECERGKITKTIESLRASNAWSLAWRPDGTVLSVCRHEQDVVLVEVEKRAASPPVLAAHGIITARLSYGHPMADASLPLLSLEQTC